LLARPLSPTACEKEQLQKGRAHAEVCQPRQAASPHRAKASPSRAKAKTKAAATPPRPVAEPVAAAELPTNGDACEAGGSEIGSPHASEPAVPASPAEVPATSSIMAAVAGLGEAEKGWKERLQSDEFRKAPVPRMPRKEKVMTDEERHDKLDEIDALEQQLQEAKSMASAVTIAANAAADFVSAEAARLGVDPEGVEEEAEEEALPTASRIAEDRVKARRSQEAQERRDRERREKAQRQEKQQEADAKAKELERVTKERMQSRTKEEKERQQQQRDEAEKQKEQREKRASGAGELRLQAAKRVTEKEQAERRRAQERAEAEEKRWIEAGAESEARAAEGLIRTKLRMQQHAQELHAGQLAAEEEQRQRLQAEAEQAAEKRQQAMLSQQRSRARAAEFRQRSRQQEEERAHLDAEENACEQEKAQIVLAERQRKRNWRGTDPKAGQSPRCSSGQPSPAGSAGGGVQASLSREASPDVVRNRSASPSHDVETIRVAQPIGKHLNGVTPDRAVPSKAVSSRAPHAEPAAKRVARVPPRLPSDRVSRKPEKNVGEAAPQAGSKLKRQSGGAKAPVDRVPVDEAPGRQSRPVAGSVTEGGEDEPIRCTVGFFGVSDVDFMGDEENEAEYNCEPAAPAPSIARLPGNTSFGAVLQKPPRGSNSSRHSTPEARPAAPMHAVAHAVPVRSYSQPPLSRPPALPGSRDESPAGRGDALGGCTSPGAASNQSDPGRPGPRPQPQAQPWKQKAVQVKSADYFLNLLKAARGQVGKAAPPGAMAAQSKAGQGASGPSPARRRPGDDDGTEAWGDGRSGYADQMRARAGVVEAAQKQEEGARFDRANAVLQRVQQRAAQAPSRSTSTDSAPGRLISA